MIVYKIGDKIRFELADIIYDIAKVRHLYRSVSLIPFFILSDNQTSSLN